MGFYALSALINGLSSSALGIFAYLKNRKGAVNRAYGWTTIFIGIWSYSYFFWQIAISESSALFWCRALMAGAIFIPPAYLHFVLTLLGFHKEKRKVIISSYVFGSIFFVLNFTSLFVKDVSPKLFFNYWPNAGVIFLPFLFLYSICVIYAITVMAKEQKRSGGIRQLQIRYVILGAFLGFGGGATNYPLWYNIPIPPIGNILVSVGIAVMAYAIIKYRLMDITVLTVRGLIFSGVYLFILGIPFWIGYKFLGKGLWMLPVSIMAVFATIGPFIYNYFRRRAEDVVLKNQHRYQETLRKLSATLTLVKDLNRLLKLVVFRVARAVRVEFACIYLADENKLIQKYPYTIKGFFPDFPKELSFDSDLIRYISSKRKPVFAEELASISDGFSLKSGLIVPSFVRKRLLGFLVLGPKSSGTIYNEADANMFGILANQLALAIENSQFIDEHERTQAELFSRERMASLGTMAGGMTHQINNRFNAISMATSDTIDTLKFIDLEKATKEELKDYLNQIAHALERIQKNALQGGKLVNDFLNFSQPDRLQKEAVVFDLRETLERAIEMARIKRAFAEEIIEKLLPENPLKVSGSFVMIQDTEFNLVDNALDALDRKNKAIQNKELPQPEGGYKGKIVIQMYQGKPWAVTKIQDNGIGITKEQLGKLFTPFFTTKATAIKGTGFGLFVIYKIIEAHGGTIEVESEYGKGTTFIIKLPLAKQGE